VNDSRAFFVPPDGSKEGWSESDEGDGRRDQFIAWLHKHRYSDGSGPLKWVEVRVSDDDLDLAIERHYRSPDADGNTIGELR
jgi:hypothetical protein